MISLRLPIDPVPASRPRVTRWGTYYGKRHQAFRVEALALLEKLREEGILPKEPSPEKLTVIVAFKVKKPRTSKLVTPRGDIDNYSKVFLDCCTGFVWRDDVQIEKLQATKAWAKDEGYIDLTVLENSHESED